MVENNELSRRSFLKRSGALTLGSVVARISAANRL